METECENKTKKESGKNKYEGRLLEQKKKNRMNEKEERQM